MFRFVSRIFGAGIFVLAGAAILGDPREVSQVLQKVFSALRAEEVSKEEIAEALRVHPTDTDELVFGLALTSLDGIARRSEGGRSRPSLTLVSSKD